ncbi:tRNA lysidine(34) synthetase TilS [Maribacter cobaltidurans]|uniref:tRNA(Ile)-lysidine synthase n=1 Tax=Maribacter cobaltidurans TaxID=1178778 RepID=A0A223VAR8_9FLAO|nr:tRNA lysidine(34) synthetase TilS [Maribacter cobaltidurans]ASV32474.1 tRNA lysidine(34) synthetase TilS [Maribacter cobaltidurans]GGD75222.1 tRNA(Ile)-lysidine synthase [Maribacter cobaltidurans]
MLKDFQSHISKNFPELLKNKFLLACSGGLDSVLLSYLCKQNHMDFILAHCNFRLRGADSNGDEDFVKELGHRLGKPVYVTHFDTMGYVNNHNVSVQMAARDLRYHWFKGLMEEHAIEYLVTAHHADDNLETFLINLSRGTGIEGLTGIPETSNQIRRPLLKFTRQRILEYAQECNLEWREDESNSDTKYLRNKIRLEIVPKLKELHPTFMDNFERTLGYLKETREISKSELKRVKRELFKTDGQHWKISISELKKLQPIEGYLHGLFQEYGFTQWNDILLLLDALSGKTIYAENYVLLKNRNHLILGKNEGEEQEEFEIQEGVIQIQQPIGLEIKQVSEKKDNQGNIIYVDKNTLKFPLTVRKWKEGDYFYPLGMQGKKKLSKYFKDEKLDLFAKKEQWLLCSNDEVVWVIGRRADDRFKVKDTTKQILSIAIQ